MMRRLLVLWLATLATAHAAPLSEEQLVLSAFTEPAVVPGGPLWVTLLTDRTIEALWRDDPARATLQIEVANAGTSFYMMGLATRDVSIVPEVTIVQDDQRTQGRIVNVTNLNGRTAREGSALLGLLEFDRKIDVTRPFVVELGSTTVAFAIDPALADKWKAVTMPTGKGF
jgi:hypothetical protein